MTTPLPVDVPRALAFRLARQHLLAPAPDALAAARSLIGAQAQVHSAAVLQLRARSPACPDASVARALYDERSLVKMWAQRSTLHLVPRDDLGLVLRLRQVYAGAYHAWYAREGLTPDQVDRLVAAVAETLALHGPHSRMDLSRRLVPVMGDWAKPWLEHSWGGIIKLAAALGHVCHGPPRLKADRAARAAGDPATDAGEGADSAAAEALFVSLPHWAAPPPLPGEREGLAELVRRYLAVYGPATPADARKFFMLYAEPIRQAFADLAPELLEVDLAGRRAYALKADEAALRTAEPPAGHIAVLPLFDPWLLAHADTGQYLDDRHRGAVYRTAGWISPVVLRQGRVVATWTHKRTASGWQVALTPLTRVYKKELRPIERALSRLAEGPVRLTVG